jgi:cytochrome c peroxidase
VNVKKVFIYSSVVSIFIFIGLASHVKSDSASLTPIEQLGKHLFFDKISSPNSMSCADCHGPSTGFTGPIPGINKFGAVYRGAVPQRFGNRKPPSAAYATLSPIFHYEAISGMAGQQAKSWEIQLQTRP